MKLTGFKVSTRENERIKTLKDMFAKSFSTDEDPRTQSFKKYLDLGCGDGNISYQIGKFLKCDKIYGADILVDPESTPKGVEYLRVENNLIPLRDNSVDFISCFVCIHHFSDINKMFKEICRILKPGGYLYIRDHDIKTTKDYVLINLIHILYGAKDKTCYEGTYFSFLELRNYLTTLMFTELTTLLYPLPNPQNLYHVLLKLNDVDIPNCEFDQNLKIFDGNFDTVEWLNNEIQTREKMYIKNIVHRKMNKIYGISISETKNLLSEVKSEKELYDKLC